MSLRRSRERPRGRTRRRLVAYVAAGIGAVLLASAVIGVPLALKHSVEILTFWSAERSRPVHPRAFVLVALGDSSMQGIGATRAEHTIAGRVASAIVERTGRSVQVKNYARGGATVADILSGQLPHADITRADIILISSANDMEQRVNPARYAADVARLVALLPAGKTVWSDLPVEPGRSRYQHILRDATDTRGIARADFVSAFRDVRWPNIFSWLPPHLNDRGYALWARAFEPAVTDIITTRER